VYLSATVFTLEEPIGSKSRLLEGVPLFDALVRREPLAPKDTKFCHKKLETFEAAHGENCVILTRTVLIQGQGVTDGRTDRRTDAQAIAKTREVFCYRA